MSIAYDPTLVMLSVFVAIIGSLTGMAVTFGHNGSPVRLSLASPIRGALTIGGSIWSMHFIGMLAVKFPVPADYAARETLLSLCAAVLFTGIGLTLASLKALGRAQNAGCRRRHWKRDRGHALSWHECDPGLRSDIRFEHGGSIYRGSGCRIGYRALVCTA